MASALTGSSPRATCVWRNGRHRDGTETGEIMLSFSPFPPRSSQRSSVPFCIASSAYYFTSISYFSFLRSFITILRRVDFFPFFFLWNSRLLFTSFEYIILSSCVMRDKRRAGNSLRGIIRENKNLDGFQGLQGTGAPRAGIASGARELEGKKKKKATQLPLPPRTHPRGVSSLVASSIPSPMLLVKKHVCVFCPASCARAKKGTAE